MQILVKSWDAVSKEAQNTSLSDADDPFKSLSDSISELKKREVDSDILNADEFVDIDFEVSTSRSNELSDEEIVKIVLNEHNEDDDLSLIHI